MADAVSRLAAQIAQLHTRVDRLGAGPQLAYSSLEDGSIDEYGADGKLKSIVGKQHDGSHGAYPVSGPAPPRPTAPTVTAGTTATVGWDGVFVNAEGQPDPLITAPMDWSRAELHISQVKGFTADTADTLFDTIESPRGGSRPVLPAPGKWYVVLVARSLAGKRSEQSAETGFEVVAGVDGPAVQELRDELAKAALELVHLTRQVDVELPQQIDDAAASPITDARLPTDGSLTRWPFAEATIPGGALKPGAVGVNELADFSILARKMNTNQHIIY